MIGENFIIVGKLAKIMSPNNPDSVFQILQIYAKLGSEKIRKALPYPYINGNKILAESEIFILLWYTLETVLYRLNYDRSSIRSLNASILVRIQQYYQGQVDEVWHIRFEEYDKIMSNPFLIVTAYLNHYLFADQNGKNNSSQPGQTFQIDTEKKFEIHNLIIELYEPMASDSIKLLGIKKEVSIPSSSSSGNGILYRKILYWGCAALLLLAVGSQSSGFYLFLRVVVTIGGIVAALELYRREKQLYGLVFGIIALVFNPVIPVYLHEKEVWMPIDLICSALFASRAWRINSEYQ